MTNEIEIFECDNIATDDRFRRIEPNPAQKARLSQLYSQMPGLIGSRVLADSYRVVFPPGVYGELMSYVGGGQGTPIVNVNGCIIDHAALYKHGGIPALLTCFSALSIVTGQYFLTEIDHNFQLINNRLDSILSFLNKDKEKGMEADIEYIQDTYENYSAIMSDSARRTACLTNAQTVRRNANQNAKFYANRISPGKQFESLSTMETNVNSILSNADCLVFAAQTYVACSLLEYALFWEHDFTQAQRLEENLIDYIDKYDSILSDSIFRLSGHVEEYKLALGKDHLFVNRQQHENTRKVIGRRIAGKKRSLDRVLTVTEQSVKRFLSEENYVTTYYIDGEGNLYISNV